MYFLSDKVGQGFPVYKCPNAGEEYSAKQFQVESWTRFELYLFEYCRLSFTSCSLVCNFLKKISKCSILTWNRIIQILQILLDWCSLVPQVQPISFLTNKWSSEIFGKKFSTRAVLNLWTDFISNYLVQTWKVIWLTVSRTTAESTRVGLWHQNDVKIYYN